MNIDTNFMGLKEGTIILYGEIATKEGKNISSGCRMNFSLASFAINAIEECKLFPASMRILTAIEKIGTCTFRATEISMNNKMFAVS